MQRRSYPSDLSEREWAILELLISPAKPGGHPRTTDMREVLNAILYVDRTGCQWRALPHEFPRLYDGVELLPQMAHRWHLETHAQGVTRTGAGEAGAQAHAQRGDHRQSVGENERKRGPRGSDGGKKVKGGTRHLLVDTNGLMLHVLVHEANIQDHNGGRLLREPLGGCFPRLKLIWADSAYKKGGFCEWAKETLGWERARGAPLERPARRLGSSRGRGGLGEDPPKWLPCAEAGAGSWSAHWPGFRAFRRLSKDYEVLKSSEEAWIYIAMIRIMLRRLAQNSS